MYPVPILPTNRLTTVLSEVRVTVKYTYFVPVLRSASIVNVV